jgi:hypothetical protein
VQGGGNDRDVGSEERKAMKKERFDEIMSAITFAQAGEHEEARSILQGRNKVLLAVSDVAFDHNVLSYALSIGKRTGSSLEILYLTRTGKNMDEVKQFVSVTEREGVPCTVTKRDGCMKQAILDLTTKKREIRFVVVGTTPELDIECSAREKSLSEAWKKLKCPLVIVSKGEMTSTA